MRVKHLNREQSKIGESGRPINITFTGPLILSGDPLENTDAATKRYVDTVFLSLDASNLKSGILPVGRLPAFNGDVTNVAGSNVFTLNPSGVNAGTYAKVTVDSKGRVIGHSPLVASDIPSLDWGKITKNKPTTLEGYGITDGINLSGDSVVGTVRSTATPVNSRHAVTRKYIEDTVFGEGSLIPAGIVVKYATNITPNGFLRCNGATVSKTTYAELYNAIGDRFGYLSVIGSGQPWRQQYAFNILQSTDITGWSSGTDLPATLSRSQAIVTKNRVYTLGGYTGSNPTNVVYTAPIREDGTLGAWTTGTSLPATLENSQAIVTKNRVYLLGGSGTSAVYTAPINTDGTLGTWTTGTSLPRVLSSSQAIVTKNRVYMLGGSGTSAVYTAPINKDGTLGAWTTGTSLPRPLSHSQAIVTKNRVYLLGRNTSNNNVATVYTAPINEDGTLGAWTTGTSLPATLENSQAIVTKGKIYLLGGRSGTTNTNTVRVANFTGGLNDYSDYYSGKQEVEYQVNTTYTTSGEYEIPEGAFDITIEGKGSDGQSASSAYYYITSWTKVVDPGGYCSGTATGTPDPGAPPAPQVVYSVPGNRNAHTVRTSQSCDVDKLWMEPRSYRPNYTYYPARSASNGSPTTLVVDGQTEVFAGGVAGAAVPRTIQLPNGPKQLTATIPSGGSVKVSYSLVVSVGDENVDFFRLPDFTSKDTLEERHYIKY